MKTRMTVLAALLLLSAGSANAGSATANLTVTANVSAVCTATTTTIAFGTYDPSSGTAKDAEGGVAVTCTEGTTYTIALDAGANSGTGTAPDRRMSDGSSHYLSYQIYLETGRTTVWGNGTAGSLNPATGNFTGNGAAQPHSAYGRVPAGQYVAPGSYTDTVIATISFN